MLRGRWRPLAAAGGREAGLRVQVVVEAADGSQRLLYTTAGAHTGALPNPGFPMGYGNTTWTILALEVDEDTLEGRLVDGDILADQIALSAQTSARVGSHFQSAAE